MWNDVADCLSWQYDPTIVMPVVMRGDLIAKKMGGLATLYGGWTLDATD